MARAARRDEGANEALLLGALAELGGAALVLDAELRIVAATAQAEALVGFELTRGALAPRLLCGSAKARPVAEAMAAGRAVSASIASPSGRGTLRVQALPMSGPEAPHGWVLLLASEAGAVEGAELFHGMWTGDVATKRLFRWIERVARSDATVLVRGETGSGKERVAEAIHHLSPRAKGPFRAINCAAMPQALLESELFGHVKGAFTGAVRDTEGHFAAADGGTLFLDEVAEMPLEVQAKMLRVLETREFLPVGGRDPRTADVRIVAATHRALRKEVEEGRFRADLMYRLRVIPLYLPPLRERAGDVPLLTEKLVESMNPTHDRQILRISPGALAALTRYDWPGNIRELRNVLSFAYVIGEGPVLLESDLPPEILEPAAPRQADRRELDPSGAGASGAGASGAEPSGKRVAPEEPPRGVPSADLERIRRALDRSSGSRARAAKILGMSRVTLWRRMKELGLVPVRQPP